MERQNIGSVLAKDRTGLTADETLASLFQPDTLLSAQYFDNLCRKTLFEPEKRLMLALLEDAIRCFQDNLSAQAVGKKKLFDEAEQWIIERDGDWIFSFDHVCEVLGFTPGYVRQGLLRWKEKHRPKHRDAAAWPEVFTHEGDRKARSALRRKKAGRLDIAEVGIPVGP